MPTIQESLRSYIETTLNANTQGILFKIFNYETKENQDSTFEDTITNSYRLQEKKFIPGILLDFVGDTVPISGITAINYTIPLQLYVPTDGALITSWNDVYSTVDFDKFLLAIDEFRTAIVGTNTTVDGINVVFNIDALTPIGDIDESKLDNNLSFGINIYANTSKELYFGNQVTYSLDGETVIPIERLEGRSATTVSEQILGDDTALSIIKDNVWETNLSLYYQNNTVLNKIMKQITKQETEQNTEYTLVVTYPTFSYTKQVILIEGGIVPNLGEYIIMSLTFREVIT